MSLKKHLITAGFVLFAVTQFMISLPAYYGLAAWLRPLTRVYETLGLKHRWSLFTHPPEDTVHAWYDVRHIVRITSAEGVRQSWILPQYPSDFFSRYLQAREMDYVKNIWLTSSYTGLPLLRAHARQFTLKNPSARFPLRAEILQSFQKIREPLSGEIISPPTISVLFSRIIRENHRRCSERDFL